MYVLVLYAEFTSNDNPGSSQQPQMTSGSGIDDGKILIGWDQLLMCMLVLYAELISNDKQGSSQQPQMISVSGIDDGKILIGWDQLLMCICLSCMQSLPAMTTQEVRSSHK